MEKTVYAGTYTGRKSEGIYSFSFYDGKLSDPQLFAGVKNPKYISVDHGIITAVADFSHGSGVAVFNGKGEIIDQIAFEERTSCHVAVDGNDIYTANYHTGTVTHLVNEDGKLRLIRSEQIQDGAGCHQVILWKDCVLVPCLFLDRVVIFDRDLNYKGSLKFGNGSGPRHGVITKDGEYLYLVTELSNQLYVIHTGDWKVESVTCLLPNDEKQVRDTAAIHMSKDEKYVYVSTRTKNVISVLEMKDHQPTLIQCVSCLGNHPRDFMLVDQYLLCANRNSDEIVSFPIHEDGTLGKPASKISVPEAVCLVAE